MSSSLIVSYLISSRSEFLLQHDFYSKAQAVIVVVVVVADCNVKDCKRVEVGLLKYFVCVFLIFYYKFISVFIKGRILRYVC